MSRRKYAKILEAAKYYAAIDNYIQYITDASKRGQNVGKGQPRPESKTLFLYPFGYALEQNQIVRASGNAATFNTYKTDLGTAVSESNGSNVIIPIEGFTPARVNIVTGRSATGVAETSKVTGLKYLSYGGKSTSLPFGRKTRNDADGQSVLFGTIKTAILARTAGAIVSLKPEKV